MTVFYPEFLVFCFCSGLLFLLLDLMVCLVVAACLVATGLLVGLLVFFVLR